MGSVLAPIGGGVILLLIAPIGDALDIKCGKESGGWPTEGLEEGF